MARNKNARRKRSTFRKQPGTAPWMGYMGNKCRCHDCGGLKTWH